MKSNIALILSMSSGAAFAFNLNNASSFRRRGTRVHSTTENEEKTTTSADAALDPEVASKFKVMVCGSTSCSKQRRIMRVDEYATYGGILSRKGDSEVQVEDAGCLGSCKKAPCVAIMHEDFSGYVSLEGMTDAEFSDRRFHKIKYEEDMDRVWDSVENAVRVMMEEDGEEEEDENDE
mmetsp:Transcript_12859/g.19519  ORF Transcript_12859/g.19519 Transcript_12859/m.19519 type:complete len:178 (-) Transcript_12859:168-701(-)